MSFACSFKLQFRVAVSSLSIVFNCLSLVIYLVNTSSVFMTNFVKYNYLLTASFALFSCFIKHLFVSPACRPRAIFDVFAATFKISFANHVHYFWTGANNHDNHVRLLVCSAIEMLHHRRLVSHPM